MTTAEVCIRVHPDLRKLLKRLAHRREKSVNLLLAELIEQEIEKEADLAAELRKAER